MFGISAIFENGRGFTVTHRCILSLMTVAALLCTPGLTLAQAPTSGATSAPPPAKSTVKADMVPSLFVMNARGASLQGQTLTLTGVSPNSIVFADRPVRAAGHLLTEHLLEEWSAGSFAKDPPNATVSVSPSARSAPVQRPRAPRPHGGGSPDGGGPVGHRG
jgi:hypothetical protein